jgi:hypothetical protein
MIYDKKFLRIAGVVLGVAVVIFALFIVFRKSDTIVIGGYDDKVHNLTSANRDFIFKSLYNTVSINMPKGESPNVNDAVIRKGSDSQVFDKSRNLYEGEFIVDMKSIEQSYHISYLRSDDENNVYIRGDTFITCLPEDELIYGDFDCVDMFSEQDVSLKDQFPYVDISGPFKITYTGEGEHGEMKLAVTNSTPDGRKNALKWLRSKNIDPTDVVIDYFGYDNPFTKSIRGF